MNTFALDCKTALCRALSYPQWGLTQISEIPGRERALPPRRIHRPLPFPFSKRSHGLLTFLGVVRIVVSGSKQVFIARGSVLLLCS